LVPSFFLRFLQLSQSLDVRQELAVEGRLITQNATEAVAERLAVFAISSQCSAAATKHYNGESVLSDTLQGRYSL